LWKTNQEFETVREVYRFNDQFQSLVFGMSMLGQIGDDGRMRSKFFLGGGGQKAHCFQEWLSVVEGRPHFQVTLNQPLFRLVSWLAHETSPLINRVAWAQEKFGVRSPSWAQIKLCEAVTEAFALGCREWGLWNFVGRATRHLMGEEQLETWRHELCRRYAAITAFHKEVSAAFLVPTDSGGHNYLMTDEAGYRSFIDRTLRELSDCLSATVALAIEETLPSTLVARFEGSALIEGKAKPNAKLRDRVTERLGAAFPSSTFEVNIKEVAA
jgi:hypothetical protein